MTGRKKIFVIDDNKMYASLLSEYLENQKKYEVFTFESGEECLENLFENPDFVILDYNLKAKDENAKNGIEILDLIKKENENIKVIMLSSLEKYGLAAQSIAKGAVYYVIKDNDAFKSIDELLESRLV